MKKNETVLLVSDGKSYLAIAGEGELHTENGVFDLKELLKKDFGDEIKTHLGKKFTIAKSNINDILEKRIKRSAQIITPKDVGLILAFTGVEQGSLVVDGGTGSGFLAISLANYVKPGLVVTYENDARFAKVAEENIESSGLSKFIKLKRKDMTKGIDEKNVDLVTLDLQSVVKVIKYAYKVLKPGGYLVVYSPCVEQVRDVVIEMRKKGFFDIRIIENIVREWQVEKYTRPKTLGLMHTGFLTFGRKMV